MTPQEFADLHNVYVTMEENGAVWWDKEKPHHRSSQWYSEGPVGTCPFDVLYPEGTDWRESLVCPKWQPKDGAPVAVWNEGDVFFYVYPYGRNTDGSVDDIPNENGWDHVSHYSGQLDMHIEAIKDEPRLK